MKNLNKMKIAPDMQYEIGQDKVGYFPEWSVKDDATLWQKVNKLAHSTFDLSKFTVVGSPVITNDGIVSGFSGSDYITVPKLGDFSTFKIKTKFKITKVTGDNQVILTNGAHSKGLSIFRYNNGSLATVLSSNGTTGDIASESTNSWPKVLELNTDYYMLISFDGTKYTFDISTDGENYINYLTVNSSTKIYAEYAIYLGYIGNYWVARGVEFDLKQFSITVDGVEVFSGNKTGIDVIKPTNFTVNATMYCFKQSTNTIYANNTNADADHIPTELYNADGTLYTQSASGWQIVTVDDVTKVQYNGNDASYDSTGNITRSTANSPMVNPPLPWDAGIKITQDGIASNFNRGQILFSNNILADVFTAKNWRIETGITTITRQSSGQMVFLSGHYSCVLTINDRAVGLQLSSNGTSLNLGTHYSTRAITLNKPYIFSLERDASHYYAKVFDVIEKEEYTFITVDSTDDLYINSEGLSCIGNDSWYTYLGGTIDLNGFKIFKNGELVKQLMFYIPYTEGQSYVKVVDKLYRDRVKDLFEQKGYNGYYTIGEDDFTLPSNKWSDVIEHKENGLTVAEQRVDQTLTIRGACEQGVDVNLPMEFFSADSYAVFGVGTTGTNTASKFTPAADGNYIAIGKGKV